MGALAVSKEIKQENARVLDRMSLFLNLMPDAIDAQMMDELCKDAPRENKEYAYGTLLAACCGLDTEYSTVDKSIFRNCFTRMAHLLETSDYTSNPFYRDVYIPCARFGDWELKTELFKPYEAFLKDESDILADGRLIPSIGFFEKEFRFPAVLQNGREWMTVTPHEINSTSHAVKSSRGKVLTYGLGIGYFTYLASLKDDVESVTAVELDENVITLFNKYILPQLKTRDKIRIINADALVFSQSGKDADFDFVFADIWHDPSDGVELYRRFKGLEKSGVEYAYWIEKTLLYYMSSNQDDDFAEAPFRNIKPTHIQ